MNELALFAGAGGGIRGGHLLGWRTVCAVEWEPYPASVLVARQNDGILPPFPIWDDVQTFDGRPWRGIVDVVSGGFPCQDISAAGKGAGITGERSGMWKHMARIIGEIRPQYVYVENSPMLVTRGLDVVLADLSSLGFDAKWGVVSAADVGAPHKRERIWIVANARHGSGGNIGSVKTRNYASCKWATNSSSISGSSEQPKNVAYSVNEGPLGGLQRGQDSHRESELGHTGRCSSAHGQSKQGWWSIEPNVGRVANGVAARMDRLKAIGNGQVPLCAATAWELLK